MNSQFLKTQYAGFKLDDTLASRIQFSGILCVWEVKRRVIPGEIPDDDQEYWIIKDEYGAKMSCWNKELATSLRVAETYEVRGDVKIGKGGTYLNIKSAAVLNGGNFHERTNSEPDRGDST